MNENVDKEKEKTTEVATKIENTADLKKEYPELTKEIEDTATKAAETAAEAKAEEKKEEIKKEVMGEIQPTIDKLNENYETAVSAIRESITALSEVPGVIPEDMKKEGDKEEDTKTENDNSETETLRTDLKAAQDKIAELEKKEKEREDAQKDAEKQTELSKALDAELEKDEHKNYAKLIREELIKDNKVLVENAEAIPEAVKNAKEKISNIAVEAKKAEITKDIEEKGLVENQDEDEKIELTEEQVAKMYDDAVGSGYSKDLPTFKKEVLKLEG
jgi:hypothetical protein